TLTAERTEIIPVNETENICMPGEKEYAKIQRFTGYPKAPLLIVLDPEGNIKKIAGSWATLISGSEL
ncbi:hypothetical protein, partial [Lentimicrobium sp.]